MYISNRCVKTKCLWKSSLCWLLHIFFKVSFSRELLSLTIYKSCNRGSSTQTKKKGLTSPAIEMQGSIRRSPRQTSSLGELWIIIPFSIFAMNPSRCYFCMESLNRLKIHLKTGNQTKDSKDSISFFW